MFSSASSLSNGVLSLGTALCATLAAVAQTPAPIPADSTRSVIKAHLDLTPAAPRRAPQLPPAVLWLQPLSGKPIFWSGAGQHSYQLVQKDKMFRPHLLVIPAGSLVSFPNEDPFFHNVFSLFEGKRFDLGLYEAGSTREVRFANPGISYVFCNIHPTMSAVVIALTTPWFAIADPTGAFSLQAPEGNYAMHVWVEGAPQSELDRLTRVVHIDAAHADLGRIAVQSTLGVSHTNKFGQPYTNPAVTY